MPHPRDRPEDFRGQGYKAFENIARPLDPAKDLQIDLPWWTILGVANRRSKRNRYMHLPNWYLAHCHEPFDPDAELKDIADSDHEQNSLRVVALLSIGVQQEEAFLRCRELLETVQWAAGDHPAGKRRLAALLGALDNDYQRALYYALAGRGAIAMLSILKQLSDTLESRYLLNIAATNQGVQLRRRTIPI